jgi:hypothetical protein
LELEVEIEVEDGVEDEDGDVDVEEIAEPGQLFPFISYKTFKCLKT